MQLNSLKTPRRPALHAGFTLIEMAVVLLIVGLLLGGMLMPLSSQMENGRRKDTQRTLQDVSEALLGFAVAYRRLPCPDTSGDGVEDSPCVNIEGDLPWATLGVGREDAWHRRMRYRANNAFTTSIPDPPNTTGGLSVRDWAGGALSAADPDAPAAIIFSCGKDGLPNGENDANLIVNTSADCTNPGAPNAIYIQNPYLDNSYDDLLVTLSKNTLLNRLAGTGKWP